MADVPIRAVAADYNTQVHGRQFESPSKYLTLKPHVMARYSRKSQEDVREEMHEMKRGELHSGKSSKKVTNPRRAIAIGLSEARKEGAKVPFTT